MNIRENGEECQKSFFKDQVLAIVEISTPEPRKRSIHNWEKIFLDTGKFLIFTEDTDFSKKIKMNYTSQDLETFSKVDETSEAIQYFFQL